MYQTNQEITYKQVILKDKKKEILKFCHHLELIQTHFCRSQKKNGTYSQQNKNMSEHFNLTDIFVNKYIYIYCTTKKNLI